MLARLTDVDWRGVLRQLLPRGPFWRRGDQDAWSNLLLGLAGELARVHNRLLDVLEEADPRAAADTLAAWEAAYGLPDETAGPAATVEARRQVVHARVVAQGGQTPAYFVQVASALGLDVTVEERPYEPFVAGSHAGELLYDWGWAYVWIVHVTNSPGPEPQLEALFARLRPAHTVPHFSYEG